MSSVELKVPDIGDFAEVEVIEVLVSVGDTVAADQSLVTVESDKASMEIPAEQGGVVRQILVKVGDKVAEGSALVVVEADTPAAASQATGAGNSAAAPASSAAVAVATPASAAAPAFPAAPRPGPAPRAAAGRRARPPGRRQTGSGCSWGPTVRRRRHLCIEENGERA